MTILANGTLSDSIETIFVLDRPDIYIENPDATIEKITFFNTNGIGQTAILSLQTRNDTVRVIRQFILQENEGGEYTEPGEFLELKNGDQLLAKTTTAGAVNFVIIGRRV